MALFFSTSTYDDLCQMLNLPDFHLAPAELERLSGQSGTTSSSSATHFSSSCNSAHRDVFTPEAERLVAAQVAHAPRPPISSLRCPTPPLPRSSPPTPPTRYPVAAAGREDAGAGPTPHSRTGRLAPPHGCARAVPPSTPCPPPLCNAAVDGDVPHLRSLIAAGSPPGAANVDSRTALHIAAAEGSLEVLRYLVEEAGAPVVRRDRWGRTPLDDAEANGHTQAAEYLRAHGGAAQSVEAATLFRRRAAVLAQASSGDTIQFADLPWHLLEDTEEGRQVRRRVGLPEPPSAEPPAADPTSQDGSPPSGVPPIGLVHAKLCELLLSGLTPLQPDGIPDAPSAAHHLLCAAAAGDPRALRDVRSLLCGLSSDELIPGVSLSKLNQEQEQRAAALRTLLGPRLAATGDVAEMLALAEAQLAEGHVPAAAAWLRAAVRVAEKATEPELGSPQCALHALLHRLSELQAQMGEAAAARASLLAAAEAAREAGAFKLGMKWDAEAEAIEE
eukprot:scaffold1954_cov113-Isochrysis_galbana.AAC.8